MMLGRSTRRVDLLADPVVRRQCPPHAHQPDRHAAEADPHSTRHRCGRAMLPRGKESQRDAKPAGMARSRTAPP